MGQSSDPSRRWENVCRSLLAGYQHHVFRSVKKLGGRSDHYVLYQENLVSGLLGGRVEPLAFAVADLKFS